ncbi:MAG: ribosome biogenesis GTPase Der [Bacteroidales bacterium]|nr:ribosome biogenesis GTPase Der [Bacteroidales bacterium]MCF8403080.1 ribosome biogenesis GTPase Der [Bacteroidales bacterium]
MSNILAIVGRPNVGKSTLFNRLTTSRQAIVEETSGVTRDRHYGKADWNGVEFSVIDTGGYVVGSEDVFEEEIRKQVNLAIDEADTILFVVDVKAGLTGLDEDVADILRRSKKKIFLVANKVDNSDKIHETAEFYQLGLDEVFPVSAVNGSGTGELLDEVVKIFEKKTVEELPDLPKFAVVGRPNVGKSSLVNAFLGDDRNIVTPVAGTTRDSIYTHYSGFGFDFLLVDTAGLRKKGKVRENIEFYSALRAVRVIESSDVCFLMIDATEGFEAQDQNIFHLIVKNRKGVVIIVNKWDLIEKETKTHLDFEAMVREKTAPFSDVPIVFTSVPKKQRIFKALELGVKVHKNKSLEVSTSKLNDLLLPIIAKTPPPAIKGKYVKIKYITQLKTAFPAFVFFCNSPQYIREPYKRFLENQMRNHFDLTGVPVQIYFRKK